MTDVCTCSDSHTWHVVKQYTSSLSLFVNGFIQFSSSKNILCNSVNTFIYNSDDMLPLCRLYLKFWSQHLNCKLCLICYQKEPCPPCQQSSPLLCMLPWLCSWILPFRWLLLWHCFPWMPDARTAIAVKCYAALQCQLNISTSQMRASCCPSWETTTPLSYWTVTPGS